MILYQKDWQEQEAFPDYRTRNRSFIRLAYLFKEMGIRNHSFHLALHDPELVGVDPHDLPENSGDLELRIAKECKFNPWYFLREVMKVPSQGGVEPGPFIASRANIALMWVFCNRLVAFLTIPRQQGKTQAAIGITAWIYLITGVNTQIGLFTKDEDLVQECVDKLKNVRDNLPQYLVHKIVSDTENKNSVAYKGLNNRYLTYKPQTSKLRAKGLARGKGFVMEHWDELPYFKFNYLSYPAAINCISTSQPNAWKNGLLCANMITTTAGLLDSKEGIFAFNIVRNSMPFNEKLYDMENKDRLLKVLDANSRNRILYIEFSAKQLGANQEWWDMMEREITDRVIYLTDVLNRWIHGTEDQILPQDVLDRMQKCKTEPQECTMFESLVIRWYREPVTVSYDTPIIVGVDTSDNVKKDFTSLVGVDPSDMSTVFTVRCNVTNLTYVAYCLVEMMINFPRMILVPERNKNGQFLIDLIMTVLSQRKQGGADINLFRRIYNTVIQDRNGDEESDENKEINIDRVDPTNSTHRNKFGYWTGGGETGSRKFLYSNVLMNSIPRNAERLYDASLIDEITSLIIKNGRIDHPDGGTDDTVIARMLADYFIMYGKNLHMYNLSPDEVLSCIDEEGEKVNPVEKRRQMEIEERVKELDDRINDHRTPIRLKREFHNELKRLRSMSLSNAINEHVMGVAQVVQTKEPDDKQKAEPYEVHSRLNMLRKR